MKGIYSTRKAAQLAPKYVLQMDGLTLFVAAKQGLSGVNITEDINKAMLYSVGFDSEELKISTWNIVAKIQFNNEDVKFKAVYL